MKSALFIFTILLTRFGFSQSCLGQWVTIDDDSGRKKSVVNLYKKDGKMFGEIIYLFPEKGRDDNPKCEKCPGSLKNKPVLGLTIVKNMVWDGSEWDSGTIMDPENGKIYDVKIWIDETNYNKLNVRGYIGPFYRTQTWIRPTKEY